MTTHYFDLFRHLSDLILRSKSVHRKVLTPNDFDSLAKLEAALLALQERYEKSAAPVPMDLHP